MPGNFHSVPASVLATWPAPQYDNPPDQRKWMNPFASVLLGVSTVFVTARFYLRIKRQAGDPGYDDLLIGIAWLCSVAFTVVAYIDADWYGLGRHTWWYVGAALCGFVAQITFLCSTCATKCSVLLFNRRMVMDTGHWIYATWIAIAFTICYFISMLITYCTICTPLSAYWLSYDFNYDKEFTCLDGDAVSLSVGILSVISDLYAVVLPFLLLRNYHIHASRRQRIGLNILFGLSLSVAGAGVARTYYLWQIGHTYDTSWTGFSLYVWSLLECHLAIICACAPHLRAFIRKYLTYPASQKSRHPTHFNGSDKLGMSSHVTDSDTMRRTYVAIDGKRTLVVSQEERVGTHERQYSVHGGAEEIDFVPMQQLSRGAATERGGGGGGEGGEEDMSADGAELEDGRRALGLNAVDVPTLPQMVRKKSDISHPDDLPPDPRLRHDFDNARSWLND